MSIFGLMFIGLIVGWLGSLITDRGGKSLFAGQIVGFVGAILGDTLFRAYGIPMGGLLGSFVSAVTGAMVALFVLRYARFKLVR